MLAACILTGGPRQTIYPATVSLHPHPPSKYSSAEPCESHSHTSRPYQPTIRSPACVPAPDSSPAAPVPWSDDPSPTPSPASSPSHARRQSEDTSAAALPISCGSIRPPQTYSPADFLPRLLQSPRALRRTSQDCRQTSQCSIPGICRPVP